MRPLAILLTLLLPALAAGPVAAQCRPGSACSARGYAPAYGYSYGFAPAHAAPAAPTVWDLADSSGQHWQSPDLGHLRRFVAARDAALAARNAAPVAPVAPVQPPPPVPAATGDPYGFGEWLNRTRAANHLPPLACDAGLSAIAAANSRLGFGHHGPGGYPMGWPEVTRENVGSGPLSRVETLWMADRAHRDALLIPYASKYGIAEVDGVWTANFR